MTNPFLRVFETLIVFEKIKIDDGEKNECGRDFICTATYNWVWVTDCG